MGSYHFFERMERENNYQKEYEKLERLCAIKYAQSPFSKISINSWISMNFRAWKKRGNYCFFAELKEHLGFKITESDENCVSYCADIDLNKYLLFCEMIFNICMGLIGYEPLELRGPIQELFETIDATISKAGFERQYLNGDIIIVEVNPIAVEVADCVPELADVIMEYNHYLLRGDLNRKSELLVALAKALEPYRKDLKAICPTVEDDFFYLVNNMDIRHNNCASIDGKNYNSKFDSLSSKQKEEWYDLTYEQGLTLFVMLEQRKRTRLISQFKLD